MNLGQMNVGVIVGEYDANPTLTNTGAIETVAITGFGWSIENLGELSVSGLLAYDGFTNVAGASLDADDADGAIFWNENGAVANTRVLSAFGIGNASGGTIVVTDRILCDGL